MEQREKRASTLYIVSRSVRGGRMIHFILMGLLGLLFSERTEHGIILSSILLSISLSFVWLYTTMINDAFDIEIDSKAHPERPLVRGEITFAEYKKVYLSAALLSIIVSFLLGLIPLLCILAFILLAYIYSVPPARIRDRPYATVIVGTASALSFLAGYSGNFWMQSGAFFYLPPYSLVFVTVFLIILSALSISPLVNAYRDIEGDKAAGVRNLYTLLGEERGRTLVSVMIPLLFALPLLLFHSLTDIAISLSLGMFAAIIFFKYGSSNSVFASYLVILLYFIGRVLKII